MGLKHTQRHQVIHIFRCCAKTSRGFHDIVNSSLAVKHDENRALPGAQGQ